MTIKNQKNLRMTVMSARIYVAFIVLAFISVLVITVANDRSIIDVLPAALLLLAAVISIIPTGLDAAKKLKAQTD